MASQGSSPELSARNAAGEPLVTQQLARTGVLTVRLNRPERRNAWIEAMEHQYFAALDRARDDPDVRVVIVTGTGDWFCPGVDLERLREITQEGATYMKDRRSQAILAELPKPTIAVVNGACAGLGFVHAVMADLRFTAAEARWSAAFSRIGLVAEDGVAWKLQRLVGHERAADLLLSARSVDGPEAVSLGLASRVAPRASVLAVATAYAEDLATRSPRSMAAIKRQLGAGGSSTLEGARLLAAAELRDAKAAPDYAEGVAAILEQRSPLFAGLPPSSRSLPSGFH